MAGDPPADLPLVPLISLGALDERRGPTPDAGAAFGVQEPRLFALAWLIVGGHDGAAAHALAQTRMQFVTSWTGATDAATYARLLLVPRACRAARGVRPPTTGDDLLDRLLAVQPRARAALVLHEACALDDAAVGQLLEIDQYDAASLQRHALGACRFKGVPELVRTTYDELVARVLADGLPAPVQPRVRRTLLLVGALLGAMLLAGVVVVSWRAMRDDPGFTPGDPSVTQYVILDAGPAWTRDSFDVSKADYGTSIRFYVRTGDDGLPTARVVALAVTTRPSGLGATTTEQIGDHVVEVGGEADALIVWVSAPCGNTMLVTFGVPRDDLVTAAATTRCEPEDTRRIVAPPGLVERFLSATDGMTATTASYRNADGSMLFLRTEPAQIEPELVSAANARVVRHDGTRFVVSRRDGTSANPRFTVRWLLGDASVTLDVVADLDEDDAIELARKVRRVSEERFRAEPPTTTR